MSSDYLSKFREKSTHSMYLSPQYFINDRKLFNLAIILIIIVSTYLHCINIYVCKKVSLTMISIIIIIIITGFYTYK